ncbi:PREDICTED: uncharacterized protein LOC107186932 [Dufourea novaeangliae]|uniref:Nostrin n=1 Tax=Dufourea novaeangliae TaxID=178035 RepID=A0A154P9W6_DUFNO|nr:PREDICTED: uncharacterized protein LOC107186932 [Dufourea novaeangliae]KZC08699.1 Nostrin [Dufourea novaeangliae]
MDEVRHAWASFKSGKNLSLSTVPSANDNNSSTIWYDVPVPVIIHCRDFSDVTKIDEPEKTGDPRMEVIATGAKEERFYRKNEEVSRSLRREYNEPPNVDLSDGKSLEQSKPRDKEKRHRNTVELTAVSSVKTDEDGVPTIEFSFLHADEKLRTTDSDESATGGAATANTNANETRTNDDDQSQLYDFPRNSKSCVPEETEIEIETEKVVESPGEADATTSGGNEIHGTIREEFDAESALVRNETHGNASDSPTGSAATLDGTSDRVIALEKVIGQTTTMTMISKIDSAAETKDRDDRRKRSVRSLKSGRKSYGTSDNDEYDAGIASMSGFALSSVATRRIGRSKLQKHRFGKAWEKMRCWLREETSRINEVVNKHARLQAVGALGGEARVPSISTGKIGKHASYDLTKARTGELGSITRVEEFGLTSVAEENATRAAERNTNTNTFGSREITGSCDDVELFSDDETNERVVATPVSPGTNKPCSDTENEEVDDATAAGVAGPETKDRARKAGLIKKRMLGSIRGLMASTHLLHVHETDEGGQGGFEDVRRYVKQGGDFCKELASILHERAELEATYAKGLSKLSSKLTKACAKDQGGNSNGGVNEAWRCVGEEMEAAAEAHRVWSITLSEQLAKPLRVGVAEAQGRSRKSIENSVDKAGKSLHEWRNIAAKTKKQSFACARENERLQDLARLQSISQSQQSNNKSSNHHMTEKEASKLEARRRKAEDSSRRADTEFYTVSVRAERARLEYESTVRKGAKQMELLEEERLSALKDLANVYLAHLQALAPRLQQSADRLVGPARNCNVPQDIEILKNLTRRVESNEGCSSEQLLPDFYAEHVTLAMNRERRKQALVRVLHLIRQDLERERRGREGLETLHRAFVATPAFAADESTQNVTDKLHHMRSMLLYLEAARYKVGGTLAEVEGSKRAKHPLADHILVSRDKQGLQQSVLKVPSWAKNESFEFQDDEDEIEVHLAKDHETESRHWADRTAGDGNSENPPDEDDFSDFDEFSSHSEDNNNQEVDGAETASKIDSSAEQCRAIYQYSANLNDELSLSPGDLITVHQKQPDGWWIGECRGRTGIFPATYVQVIH